MALAMIYLGVRVGQCLLACMHLMTLSRHCRHSATLISAPPRVARAGPRRQRKCGCWHHHPPRFGKCCKQGPAPCPLSAG